MPSNLASACLDTAKASQDGLAWVNNPRSSKKVSLSKPVLERILRRTGSEAKRLARTLERPSCVGVFGASQVGKSYLISRLAAKGGSLIAKFDGARPEVDFISEINPEGGEESTGLVTRFTTKPVKSPPGYPVCLRLHTQGDIFKILINSYANDAKAEFFPKLEMVEMHFAVFEGKLRPASVDVLTEEDMHDVYEYIHKYASNNKEYVGRLTDIWDRLARIAPRLSIEDRCEFLSLVWGRHEVYTRIAKTLLTGLAQIGFAEDAFCPIEALVPRESSIIDVQTLKGMLTLGVEKVSICSTTGAPVDLPRPVITALVAELRIVCRDEPSPLFRHTDLLDFPGYRSRDRLDVDANFKDEPEKTTYHVFLRGKVDYLVQRYTADLELSGMLLCMPDLQNEVTTLTSAVEEWVNVTHGSTPEKRLDKPKLLFLVLTKFDLQIREKAGDANVEPSSRFNKRINVSLLRPYGTSRDSWPNQWVPGQPFVNSFWVRNPNVFTPENIAYDDDRREIEWLPSRQSYLGTQRAGFLAASDAIRHFRDPVRAWDEVTKLNDGGVSYLIEALEGVCTPDLKVRQVEARLNEIRSEVREQLAPFHVTDDYQKRRAERLSVVDDKIFPDFDVCASIGAFGTALRNLMIDASDLYVALAVALNRPQQAQGDGSGFPRPPAHGQQGVDPAQRGSLFTSRVAAPAAVRSGGELRTDRWSTLSNAALQRWNQVIFERAEDPILARRICVTTASLIEIVGEIGRAAKRLGLAERMANELRLRAAPNEPLESVARKAALIAERVINRFVSELDFNKVPAEEQVERFASDLPQPVFVARPLTFDTSDIEPERKHFTTDFMVDWGTAFRATVAQNAASKDGAVDNPEQNARLGEILQLVAA